jgi:hypothetical protein
MGGKAKLEQPSALPLPLLASLTTSHLAKCVVEGSVPLSSIRALEAAEKVDGFVFRSPTKNQCLGLGGLFSVQTQKHFFSHRYHTHPKSTRKLEPNQSLTTFFCKKQPKNRLSSPETNQLIQNQ